MVRKDTDQGQHYSWRALIRSIAHNSIVLIPTCGYGDDKVSARGCLRKTIHRSSEVS